jgi:hypothetical protein
MAKPNKTADLLKVLGQKAPTPPQPVAPAVAPREKRTRSTRAAQPLRKPTPKVEHPRHTAPAPVRGKAIQIYVHEQDQRLIHELSAWLASQRKRINDSLVIKTVLRAAKTGPELLAAYDAAIKVDGRTREKRNSDTP